MNIPSTITRAAAAATVVVLLGAGSAVAAVASEAPPGVATPASVVVADAPDGGSPAVEETQAPADASADAAGTVDGTATPPSDDSEAGSDTSATSGDDEGEPMIPDAAEPAETPETPETPTAGTSAPLAASADDTPPAINFRLTGGGSRNAYIDGTEIELEYSCVDYDSGIVSCEESEGRPSGTIVRLDLADADADGGVAFTVTSENGAGLTATRTFRYLVYSDADVDVRTTVVPRDGASLTWWNREPVTVDVVGSAPEGVPFRVSVKYFGNLVWGSTFANEPYTLSFDTDGVYRFNHVASTEGAISNAIRSSVIRVDQTPPVISVTPSVFDDAAIPEFTLGEEVLLDYACTDATSGIDGCGGELAPGEALPTDTAGLVEIQLGAIDVAGNESTRSLVYRVVDPDAAEEPGDGSDEGEPGDEPGEEGPAEEEPVVEPAADADRPGTLATTGGDSAPLLLAATLLAGGMGAIGWVAVRRHRSAGVE